MLTHTHTHETSLQTPTAAMLILTAFFPRFSLGPNTYSSLPYCPSKNKPAKLGSHRWHASFLSPVGPGPFLCSDDRNAVGAKLHLLLGLGGSLCFPIYVMIKVGILVLEPRDGKRLDQGVAEMVRLAKCFAGSPAFCGPLAVRRGLVTISGQ